MTNDQTRANTVSERVGESEGRSPSERKAVRTYLEMTDPSQLTGEPVAPSGVTLVRERSCPPAVWRGLYTDVGREYYWVDRLGWTDEEIRQYLDDPAVELWILREGTAVAGYFELRRDAVGGVEIAYFGLLPAFTGRGFGRYLLSAAVVRAWALSPTRVWVHTSSLDHPSALPNYIARGFSVWSQKVYSVTGAGPGHS
jgi:GNAT superfamily N-acetyltransferase